MRLILLLVSVIYAAEFPARSPVKLKGALAEPEGMPTRICGARSAGSTGVIVASPYSTPDSVLVQWDDWHDGCPMWEHRNFVSPRLLEASKPKKAIPPPAAKETMTMDELFAKEEVAGKAENKSPQEIEAYLSCYKGTHYTEYLRSYKEMIEVAASAFGVNASLMKCLMFRESQWDNERMSCTCATGLGQQVLENVEAIGEKVDVTWRAYFKTIAAHHSSATNLCSGGFQVRNEEKDTQSAFYKDKISHMDRSCRRQCPVYHEDDRRCAPASIGAMAAYLRLVDQHLKKALGEKDLEWWQVDDARLAMALAYNSGEGSAGRALRKSAPIASLSETILAQAPVSTAKRMEMRNHFYAIRNCMKKGNSQPPTHGAPPKVCPGITKPGFAGGARR